MLKIKTWFLLSGLIPAMCCAHASDNTASYNYIDSYKYFRFHYDNDFFNATDYYYSQGINFEFVHPAVKHFSLTKLLFAFKNSNPKLGLSLEHDAYTPISIRHNEILVNDRPFAACIMLKTFSVSVDALRTTRLSSTISLGAIGPAAFGEGMQQTIHRALKNIEPLGWQNQIQNDVIINYSLAFEKQFLKAGNFLSINSTAEVHAGTLCNKVQIGFTLMAGKFNSPFGNPGQISSQAFSCYLFSQPLLGLAGYDATLEGGLFNRHNPYTISPENISRITFQNNAGIVFTYKKIFLEYYQSFLTREFKTGMQHRWGGIKIGVNI